MTTPGDEDLPTTTELKMKAELWNAIAWHVIERCGPDVHVLFSTRDKLARRAVVELNRMIDEYLAARNPVVGS